MADTHFDSYETPSSARALRHLKLVSYFANHYSVDLVIHGGDLNDGAKPKDISIADIKRAMNAIKLCHRPFIVLQGNHDDNSGYARDETNNNADQVITNDEAKPLRLDQFSQWLDVPTGSENPNNAVFGSYDVPNSNVTIIVLDGFDMADVSEPNHESFRHGHTDYTMQQRDWLVKKLADIPSNRKIAVFDHLTVKGIKETEWKFDDFKSLYENTGAKSYQEAAERSGLIYTALVDNQAQKHNILGFFSGHTHRDNYADSGNIHFATIACDIADRGDGREARDYDGDDLNEYAWEVIQLNPTNTNGKMVIQHRFGRSEQDENVQNGHIDSESYLGEWSIN
ncbi:metallophosphoesterase family protein [Secundilactobacillus hailunensis]|uniref:Metallophosphoesterase family protein n=1 Tax=Secundilactobacillus hailunensis TaxID=2559923 RepID=A0ABW1T9N6_9LACO|nr:metallophosphoesterase [Secundilactobacillus hailunensis]